MAEFQVIKARVIVPVIPRRSAEGFDLQLKVISKAYAKVEDEEAIS